MTKPSEKIAKRRVVLADGRYLIFYTFTPADVPASMQPAIAETEGKQETPGKES